MQVCTRVLLKFHFYPIFINSRRCLLFAEFVLDVSKTRKDTLHFRSLVLLLRAFDDSAKSRYTELTMVALTVNTSHADKHRGIERGPPLRYLRTTLGSALERLKVPRSKVTRS